MCDHRSVPCKCPCALYLKSQVFTIYLGACHVQRFRATPICALTVNQSGTDTVFSHGGGFHFAYHQCFLVIHTLYKCRSSQRGVPWNLLCICHWIVYYKYMCTNLFLLGIYTCTCTCVYMCPGIASYKQATHSSATFVQVCSLSSHCIFHPCVCVWLDVNRYLCS